jgi:colicin import membrane protein
MMSVLLHGFLAALAFLASVTFRQVQPDTTKVFELVAGVGDNYAATEAPALGSPDGTGVSMPDVPDFPAPKIAPPEPEPVPIQAAPPEPAPKPVITKAPEKAPVKTPAKEPTFDRDIKRLMDKREANVVKKAQAEAKARAEREEREAKKKMTLEEFQKQQGKTASRTGKSDPIKTKRIDGEGIAGGVRGGSTANKVGGAGGTALSRDEGDVMDAYIALVIQRLREAHRQPPGVSDLLTARVDFRIGADGTVTFLRIVESSGNAEFDESIAEAFRRIRSLPAPPNRKTDTYRTTFRIRDTD